MMRDLMQSYYAAYNAEAPDDLAALLDEEVVLISAAGRQEGRDSYLSTYRYLTGLFVDRMEPTDIAVDGDVATVRIIDRLTARDDIPDFMGQAVKKGQTVRLDLIGRYTFRDGRIRRIEIIPAE